MTGSSLEVSLNKVLPVSETPELIAGHEAAAKDYVLAHAFGSLLLAQDGQCDEHRTLSLKTLDFLYIPNITILAHHFAAA